MISINLDRFPLINKTLPVLCHVSANNGDTGWVHPMHCHQHHSELVLITKGSGRVIIGNLPYDVKKGNLLVYNRGVLHHELSSGDFPLHTYICGLNLPDTAPADILPPGASPVLSCGEFEQTIHSLFRALFQECSAAREGFEPIAATLAQCLLSYLGRLIHQNPSVPTVAADSLGYEIKAYIDSAYQQDITLASLAGKFHVSPSYLSHLFKKTTGFAPVSYVINRRLGEAEYLLLSTDLSVSEIARRVGYENTNYFNILFKKTLGISPGHFRRSSTKR